MKVQWICESWTLGDIPHVHYRVATDRTDDTHVHVSNEYVMFW